MAGAGRRSEASKRLVDDVVLVDASQPAERPDEQVVIEPIEAPAGEKEAAPLTASLTRALGSGNRGGLRLSPEEDPGQGQAGDYDDGRDDDPSRVLGQALLLGAAAGEHGAHEDREDGHAPQGPRRL